MRAYTKKSLSLLTFVIILTAGLILVNILSLGLWGRIDLTDDKRYSLSAGTKMVLAEMDDNVEIRAYLSRDLPAQLGSIVQYIKDQLSDYQAYSGGKVKFSFLDPTESSDIENEATGNGCPPLTLQQMSSDQYATKKVYLCLAFFFEDKKEIIPAVRNTEGLEYEITSILKKITARTLTKVGVLQGHGEPALSAPPMMGPQGEGQAQLSNLNDSLSRNYKVVAVDTTTEGGAEALDGVDTLLVYSPAQQLTDKDLFLIDQHLMKGKSAAFMLEALTEDLNSFQATPKKSGLEPLLTNYGVTINTDLVLDKYNQPISVTQQAGSIRYQTRMPYPFFIMTGNFAGNIGLNTDFSIVQKLDQMIIPFGSSLTLAQSTDTRKIDWLIRSSSYSWKQSGFYTLNPTQIAPPSDNDVGGPYTLAALITGVVQSYYKDKGDASEEWMQGRSVIRQSKPTRIFIVGNGQIAQDRFGDPTALKFMENLVDWLVQDEHLISIRSRGFAPQPLDPNLGAGVKSALKFGNILGVPALFLLIGIIIWQVRASRRRTLMYTFFPKKK